MVSEMCRNPYTNAYLRTGLLAVLIVGTAKLKSLFPFIPPRDYRLHIAKKLSCILVDSRESLIKGRGKHKEENSASSIKHCPCCWNVTDTFLGTGQ
jgi:hypothetical protein